MLHYLASLISKVQHNFEIMQLYLEVIQTKDMFYCYFVQVSNHQHVQVGSPILKHKIWIWSSLFSLWSVLFSEFSHRHISLYRQIYQSAHSECGIILKLNPSLLFIHCSLFSLLSWELGWDKAFLAAETTQCGIFSHPAEIETKMPKPVNWPPWSN